VGASAEDADCSSRREHPTRDRKDDDAKPHSNVAERGAISEPVEAVCKPRVDLVLELVVGMPTIVLSGPGIRRLARGSDSLRHDVPLRLLRQASGPLFSADIPQFRERRVKLPSKVLLFEAIRLIPPRSIEEGCEGFASASSVRSPDVPLGSYRRGGSSASIALPGSRLGEPLRLGFHSPQRRAVDAIALRLKHGRRLRRVVPRRGNKRGSRRSHLEGCDSLRGWPCSPFRSPIGSEPENL
jgi:hypothetical protein